MLGLVVCGSRTWMWTMAAPALAASIAEAAICAGVTGTAGFLPGVSAEPVTAHAIITLRCSSPPAAGCCGKSSLGAGDLGTRRRTPAGGHPGGRPVVGVAHAQPA